MAIDPKDLGELQRALNDAAGKASVLWTTSSSSNFIWQSPLDR